MTIHYTSGEPTGNGYYLVRVDGELDIAQRFDTEWMQVGSDYDCWQYSNDVHNIEVIRKLDLDELAG